jgi:hypothetical protein
MQKAIRLLKEIHNQILNEKSVKSFGMSINRLNWLKDSMQEINNFCFDESETLGNLLEHDDEIDFSQFKINTFR